MEGDGGGKTAGEPVGPNARSFWGGPLGADTKTDEMFGGGLQVKRITGREGEANAFSDIVYRPRKSSREKIK